jgi:hypothetical protein
MPAVLDLNQSSFQDKSTDQLPFEPQLARMAVFVKQSGLI